MRLIPTARVGAVYAEYEQSTHDMLLEVQRVVS